MRRLADDVTDEKLEREESKAPSKPNRHAVIMRGVVTPVLGLIAVACIVLGVLNATIWRPSTEITARAEVSGTRYIITDPGVLGLVDDHVSMMVEEPDDEATVCVATGSAKDVSGWLSGASYVRVTGMSEWTTLSTTEAASQGERSESDDDVSFADSDMWTSVECGDGSATLSVTDEDSTQIAIVDLGEDDSTATVSMNWVRQTVPDFAMPLYFAGGMCAVMAVFTATVFAMPPRKRRKRVVEGVAPATAAEGDAAGQTAGDDTGTVEAVQTTTGSMQPIASVPPRSKRRRRHARHGGGRRSAASPEQTGSQEPVVIDPHARNMVADQLAGAGAAAGTAGAVAGSAASAAAAATSSIGEAASGVTSGVISGIGSAGSDTTSGAEPVASQGPSTGSWTASAGNASAVDDTSVGHAEEAQTSVISQDELAAYFARLAQESQEMQAFEPPQPPESAQSSTPTTDGDAPAINWGYGVPGLNDDERRES